MSKIIEGVGNAGTETVNAIVKAEAAATMTTDGVAKTAEAAYQNNQE